MHAVATEYFPLRLASGSRSFAAMRVQTVEKIVEAAGGTSGACFGPGASLAVKNFLTVMESDDSLFFATPPLLGRADEKPAGGCAYLGELVFRFRAPDVARDRKVNFLLLEKLTELLGNAGSRETLEAKLCLTSTNQKEMTKDGLEIWLQLKAIGDTPEQAELRWGLGVAHIQQALLFTSRYLRQYLAQAGL